MRSHWLACRDTSFCVAQHVFLASGTSCSECCDEMGFRVSLDLAQPVTRQSQSWSSLSPVAPAELGEPSWKCCGQMRQGQGLSCQGTFSSDHFTVGALCIHLIPRDASICRCSCPVKPAPGLQEPLHLLPVLGLATAPRTCECCAGSRAACLGSGGQESTLVQVQVSSQNISSPLRGRQLGCSQLLGRTVAGEESGFLNIFGR